ncbi:MAG: ArnT family glycosyltransferase [Gammaproteobacteria bacterium]
MGVTLLTRPLLPVDETRYVAVAWEMWVRDDFLVPYLNGSTYSHKPPLLFWLMQLTWLFFGVNEWTPRLVAPAFSLAALFLVSKVARLLWPERDRVFEVTPFVLLGFFFWIIYSSLTMFDMMLAFFALLGIYSVLKAAYSSMSLGRWLLMGVAVGGGVLTKGPVILLHILPVALLAPWWLDQRQRPVNWTRWYLGILLGVTIGAAIALAWAIPAGMAGGEAYRNAIFLGQTSGRLVKSFAHRLPWWWYLQSLPLLLLPWLFWRPFWLGARRLTLDHGVRFCMSWMLPVFIAFSLISGKRIHYLLPLIPGAALCIARAVDDIETFGWDKAHRFFSVCIGVVGLVLFLLPWLNDYGQWRQELSALSPLWGGLLMLFAVGLWRVKARTQEASAFNMCAGALTLALVLAAGFFDLRGARYDVTEPATVIAGLLAQNKDVVYLRKYHGQYNFSGRLKQGLVRVDNAVEWARAHQGGYIVMVFKDKELPNDLFFYRHPFRNRVMALVPAKNILENEHLFAGFR